ncbi:MAG: carbohydrate kinase family protein [Roseiflexaceae bacterium]
MTYLIAGCTHINDLIYADGRTVTAQLGGSIYAVNGIKTYYDDLLFVTTVGPDFDAYFGEYYRTNQLSQNGVHQVLPHTQYNMLTYQPDGRWGESSKYGADFEAQWATTSLIQSAHILPFITHTTQGIYLESSVTEPIWQHLDAIRAAAPHATMMWEVATSDIETPARHANIADCIAAVDIYSINLPESLALFEVTSEADALTAIMAQDTPCLFRVGTKGAYMVADGHAWFAPSYDLEYSVDPTGCGNCATGAALYGMAEGLHPLHTVILANLAAALNARQYGPYPAYTATIRAEQLHRAEREFVHLHSEQVHAS